MLMRFWTLETFVQLLEQDQHHANLACNPQIESILQKARSLRDLCVKHPKLGDLESRIRDVVYKAEDLIESRIRDHVLSVLKDDTSELDLKNFMEEFDYIKEELLNMQAHPTEDFMQEQEMLNIQADPEPASSATSRSSSVSDPDLNGKMVGLTEDFHQLMDQLVGQGLRLQIMPIVGMGGVGKTTMARQLFYHQRTVKHFDSRVWITIPQKRSVRVTLLAILGCLTNLTNEMHQRDDDQLCDSINMFLRYRRYLIIVDDIWDVNTWNTIRRVCPDNANRSRIILTTRVSTCYATNTSRHYKMRFMNADESWELLRLKVFGEESFPPELVHVGKMIAGRCQGLPQAIILMAQLLSKIEVKLEHWEHFAMNANSMEVQLDSGVDILSKSYNHLPYNLKPCFLYVGAFLGDHEIRVSRIVNLWIAEGFVRGQNLEDTAKAYLKALSDENLLLVCQEQPNGRMKTFKIHFLLRKLCAKKAFEEKFLWFKHLEGHRVPEDKDQLRRVSMHPLVQPTNTMELASFVRSLLCVGPYSQRLAPFFQGLTLLRVLDVFQVEFCQFPKEILELVLLRYLSFSCKSNLPSSISRLRNLQTIVIRRFTSFGEFSLPYELWELTQLRHVKCKVTCIWYFPHNGATQENLQTLSNIQVFVVTDSLLDNIPNLRKLGLFCNKLVLSAIHLDRLSKLEKLKCSSNLSQATHNFLSYLTFPPSLRKLTLVLCKIPCGFMDTVGLLPNLEQLKLRKCAFLVIENKPTEVALEMEEPEEETEPTWEQVEDQFSALISLQMEDLNLVHWKSNGVHFPKLEHLIIRGCSSLQELPVGIAERSSIKLIEVDEYCSPSVIASARDKQKKHIDLEDDIMQVDIGGKKETPTQVDEESSPSVIASTNDEQKQQIGKSQEPLIAPEARSQMNRQIGSVNRLQVHISLLGQRYSFFDKTVILEGIFCFFLLTRWVNDLWEVHIGGILQGLLVLYFSLVAWVNHFLQVHSGGSNSDLLPNTTGTFSKRLFCFFIVVLINTGNEVLQEYTGGILGDLLLYGAEISESYNFFLGYSDGHGHDLLLKSTAILPRFVLFLFFLGFGWIHLFFNTIDGIRRDFSHYMYSNEILQICSILFFFLIGWVNNFLQEHIDAIGSDLRDTTRILRTLFFVFFMILQWVYIFLKVQIRGFFRGPFLLYHTRILQGFLFALYSFILLLRWVNNLPLVSTASLKGLFYLFMLLGWVNDYLLRHIGRSQETLNEGHNEQHKIKGTVVLMKKKLMDIPDGFAFEMDCLYEAFGKGISFQLVSAVHGDPKSGRGKRGKATTLKDWVLSTSNEDRHTFRIAFPWDDSLGVPGALVVRNNHYSQFFLKMVTLEDIPEIGQLHFICNSWVYPANRYKNDRIFFANKAYLPCDTPEPLRSYRKKELKILRGNGSSMLREWDRIYDYASYNDLGSPENGPDSARPVLGGSKEYPYPRRGRTGRPPNKTDPNSESRLFILNPNIYLPRDEQFTQVKISAYIAYVLKLLGKVLVQTIPALSFYEKANDEFESFKDVLILYDRGYKLPGGHILQKFRKYIPWELLRELTRSDGAQLFKFPIPDVIKQNKKAWRTDEEFGREMLAGVNPIIIQRVQEFPPTSKLDPGVYGDQTSTITRKHIETHMNGLTVDEAIAKDKLFILDHHDAVMLYLRLINSTETKTYATRTLLLLQDDGTLKPLAIELSLPHEDGDLFGPVSEVYTPSEHGTQGSIWQLAKVYVAVNDSGYHQLISHWLNTHAVIEPFIIATNRQLSVLHPIHKLLQPHFRDTMHINALDRHTLINAGGILEKTFFPRRYAMEMSSAIYKNWNFTEQGLPEDLLKRGMAVKDPSQPRGLRLVIEDYPYAVDGLDIWSTIESWVRAYCDFYYLSDDKVKGDSELQSWWKEVREEGHGDLKDEQWWPKMETRAELIKTCTIIIWVTSALHAAVNFGQYAYGGYLPNRPSMSRRFMPKPGTPEYAELESKPELALQKTITTKYQTLLGVSLVEILSRHSTDEIYLGQRDNPHWTADDEPQEAFKLFRSELIEIEARIRGRNNDSKLRNRSGPVKIPYTLLYPNTSSEGRQGGLNVKGIPNSISI